MDLFFHYGPLAAIVSMLGLCVHDSLLPETLICAAGYALALTLAIAIARRLVSGAAAVGVGGVLLLLIARFYKWYYWVGPLVVAAALVNLHVAPRRRRLATAGIAAGTALLFRIDLGIACLAFAVAGAMVETRNAAAAGRVLAWFAAAAGLGLALLALHGGIGAVGNLFASYSSAARGVVQAMAAPVPWLTGSALADPFGGTTAAAVAYLLLPLAGVVGVLLALGGRRPADRDLFVVALGGLAVLPQALHRADVPHLLQVLPLLALAAAAVVGRVWSRRRWAGAVVAFVALFPLWGLRPYWGGDLRGWGTPAVAKLALLARGPAGLPEHPVSRVAAFLEANTTAADSVLMLNVHSQVLFATRRRMAGLLPCYVPGLLTTPPWRVRNLHRVIEDAPRFVVLADGVAIDGRPENAIERIQPELWSWVERERPATVLQAGPYTVRAAAANGGS